MADDDIPTDNTSDNPEQPEQPEQPEPKLTLNPVLSAVPAQPDDADPVVPSGPALPAVPSGPRNQRARRIAILSARVVTGIVGVGIAVVVLAAVALVPLPSFSSPVPGEEVVPKPTELVRVCGGSLLRLGNDVGGDAGVPSAVGRPTLATGSEGTEVQTGELDVAPSAPAVLTAPPAEGALLAGSQSQDIDTSSLLGLAATGCREPSSENWLVAGDTTTGRTSILTLSNPTDVEATVALRIWGEAGAVDAPGMTGIVVAARTQLVLPLAGFAQNVLSPVVEVVSRGGQVVASLQQSTIRAVDPGGVEITGDTSAPATELVIPGAPLITPEPVARLIGREGYQDLGAVLRVLAPGTTDTTVRVSLTPETAGVEGTSFEVPLTAGTVQEIPLQELAEGYYTVRIDADAPVVAAVRSATALPLQTDDELEAPISDFAWSVAASPIDAQALVTVPTSAGGQLHLVNSGSADVTITLSADSVDGTPTVIPGGAALAVPLTRGVHYLLKDAQGLTASVTFAKDGRLAAYALAPPSPVSDSILIRP